MAPNRCPQSILPVLVGFSWDFGLPKGPGRIKKHYDVLIHDRSMISLSVEISCEFSPGK